jgi:membrane fusion protein (multidrug efflux system)
MFPGLRPRALRPSAAAVTIVVCLLAGCRTETSTSRRTGRVLVEAGPPRQQNVEVTLRYPVELSATEKVNVSPVAVSGYLTKVHVDVGDKVTAGQLLAEIDCREYSAQLRQTEEAINQRRAQLEQARAQLNRLQVMDDRKLLAPAELDQAKATKQVTEAQLHDARAKLLEASQRQGYCKLRAPFDGFVAERLLDPGSNARPGGPPVVTLVKTQQVRVVIPVLEKDIPKVQQGADAELVMQALPDHPLRAKVARIGRQLDLVTRTLQVELDLPNTAERLFPGMTGRAAIVVEKRSGALVVPVTAVLNLEEASYVFVVKDGRARRIRVELGVDLGDWLEIKKGIGIGDQVVVTGRELISDGTVVDVEKVVRRRRAVDPGRRDTPEPATSKSPDEELRADGGSSSGGATSSGGASGSSAAGAATPAGNAP